MSGKVAMMQPSFLSWTGFFELIAKSDKFIFLDDFQYITQSHHTRNRLFRNVNTTGFYLVPVCKPKSLITPLNRISIVKEDIWKKRILHGLEYNYSKAPFFSALHPRISCWLNSSYSSLAELNMSFIKLVCSLMSLPDHFRYSSDFTAETESKSTRSMRIIELLEWSEAESYLSAFGSFDYMKADGFDKLWKHGILFQNHIPKPYKQVGSKEFVPYLSMLDVLYNVGPDEALRIACSGTDKWLTWKEREEMSHE